MTATQRLASTTRLGLYSAPIIYFVEANPEFYSRTLPFFEAMDSGTLTGYTSVLALPETLAHPLRSGDTERADAFRNLLLRSQHLRSIPLNAAIAEEAARLRADHALRTPDAIHLATAVLAQCDLFLTNDADLKRVRRLEIALISDLD